MRITTRSSLFPSENFAREGFIFAYQDVRGRMKSEGEFVDVRPYRPVKNGPADVDESSDTYDTIEWLLKNVPQPQRQRRASWASRIRASTRRWAPSTRIRRVKAVSPQAPVSDWFIGDDWHHNGALFLPHTFNFYANFGRPSRPEPAVIKPPAFEYGTPDGYEFFLSMGPLSDADAKHFKGEIAFWKELMSHPTYDAFWKERNLLPHLKNIKPAMMTVGGWFDAEDLWGALHVYRSIEEKNPSAYNTLVMGPWRHGGWGGDSNGSSLGDVRFGSKTVGVLPQRDRTAVLQLLPQGQGSKQAAGGVPVRDRKERMAALRAVAAAERAAEDAVLPGGRQALLRCPRRRRGCLRRIRERPRQAGAVHSGTHQGMAPEYMVADQRFAASRTDVLVYQTDVLENDVTLAGPLTPSLFVSTTGTDSDWVVKLIDVYPATTPTPIRTRPGSSMGGYQQLVRGEPMRGKFRNSFEKPEPFEPGKVTKVEFTMPDVLPHLPSRPPDHGAGAEHLVSAGGSQPAEVRRYLPRHAGGFRESHRARVPHQDGSFGSSLRGDRLSPGAAAGKTAGRRVTSGGKGLHHA